MNKKITKKHNHSHFWIKNEVLYESYKTIRGLRYSILMRVQGMPDQDMCSDDFINNLNYKKK